MKEQKNNIFSEYFQENIADNKRITVKKGEKNLFHFAKIHINERDEKRNHHLNKDHSGNKSIKISNTLNNVHSRHPKHLNNITPFEKIRLSLSYERNKRKDKIEGIKGNKLKLNIQNNEKPTDVFNNVYLAEHTKINSPKVIQTNINLVSLQNNQLNIKKIKLIKSLDKNIQSSKIAFKSFIQTDTNKEDLSSKMFTVTHLSSSYLNYMKKEEFDKKNSNKKSKFVDNGNKSLQRLQNEGSKSMVKYMKIRKIPL